LRRLSRKIPTSPEVEKIMSELGADTDIAAAIVAAAILEAHLERLISTRFFDKSSELKSQLFLNQGPLASLHSKILVAQAFGFITSVMAADMHSIKLIRNAFAHAKTPISFDNEFVAKEVENLKITTAIRDSSLKHKDRAVKLPRKK